MAVLAGVRLFDRRRTERIGTLNHALKHATNLLPGSVERLVFGFAK
jgi:hypothetical protein